jgi:uncharacterized protein YkwD
MTPFRASSRAVSILLLALAAGGCSILPFDIGGPSLPVTVTTADAGEAARLITAYRRSRGLGPVAVDARLNEPAAEQARAIAKAGDLSHGDFAGRMARHDVSAAAENLAMGSPTVAGAVTQWRESAPHNANLLKEGHTRIGFARAETQGRGGNRYWALVLAR